MRIRGLVLAAAVTTALSHAPHYVRADSQERFLAADFSSATLRLLQATVRPTAEGFAASPALIGVVEGVDGSGSVQISGQRVDGTVLEAAELRIGQYVRVDGVVRHDGISADRITDIQSRYIPGASLILVSGYVSKHDASRGEIRVGAVQSDVTQALHTGHGVPNTNDFVQVVGIQPLADGPLVASDLNAIIGGDRTDAIIGGDRTDAIIGGDRTDAIIGGDRTDAIIGGDRTDAIIGGDRS